MSLSKKFETSCGNARNECNLKITLEKYDESAFVVLTKEEEERGSILTVSKTISSEIR